MGIHKGKRQYHDLVTLQHDVYAIHSIQIVIFARKQLIYGITVCEEMPAPPDLNSLASDNGRIESQIRLNLHEQFIITNPHHISAASYGCSPAKVSIISYACNQKLRAAG